MTDLPSRITIVGLGPGNPDLRTVGAQRALDATSQAMPQAVGRLYVERYFPAAMKARVQAIVADVNFWDYQH